ncbi:DUF982 domain-containing protein [Oryzifoliimicrobium ureilyticus]|uniref:DUF982 domain-containing protein n=1 Tax=Oryzifoliimicrobium ureilyticus TaxID=3113724 RepID=UPI003076693F
MKRDNLAFSPIGVALHSRGKYRVVTSVHGVAETLLEDWPIDDGEDFADAIICCVNALHRKASPQAVRAAFVRAAREANVMVLESVGAARQS